jgi:hypothetical protein
MGGDAAPRRDGPRAGGITFLPAWTRPQDTATTCRNCTQVNTAARSFNGNGVNDRILPCGQMPTLLDACSATRLDILDLEPENRLGAA